MIHGWQVVFVDPNSKWLFRSDGSRTVGVTDYPTKTIYLSDRLRGEFLWRVLCHEICHVAMFTYGVDLDLETEEIICDIVARYGREIVSTTEYLIESMIGVA